MTTSPFSPQLQGLRAGHVIWKWPFPRPGAPLAGPSPAGDGSPCLPPRGGNRSPGDQTRVAVCGCLWLFLAAFRRILSHPPAATKTGRSAPNPLFYKEKLGFRLEAAGGFEPPNNGFANRRLGPLGYAALAVGDLATPGDPPCQSWTPAARMAARRGLGEGLGPHGGKGGGPSLPTVPRSPEFRQFFTGPSFPIHPELP